VRPPSAPRRPCIRELHGLRWNDDWAWLADRDDPAVLAYLEAENAWAEHVLAASARRRDRIFDEIRRRTQETDRSAPVRHGPWWYQIRTVEGLDYGLTVRWAVDRGIEDDAQVVLDANAEAAAAGSSYFDIGVLEPSPDHRLVAWSSDTDGGEVYELRIRDMEAPGGPADLPDRIPRTSPAVAWSADGRHLLYTVPDEAMRPHQVWRHELGRPPAEDVLVLEEPDERFAVHVETTRSGAFVLITAGSMTTTEVWAVPAADPTAAPRSVDGREDGHEYHVDHRVDGRGDRFVLLTNLDAEDFRVVEVPVDRLERAAWREVLPHRPGRRVTDVAAFRDALVVAEWRDALPRLLVLRDAGAAEDGGPTERELQHPDAVWDVHLGQNPEYDTTRVRFGYTSFAVPAEVYEEDLRTGERVLLKRQPVPDVDLSAYRTARTWATAHDGTRVPVSIVHHRDVPRDGTAPLLLYGYGAYEASTAPWFSTARLSLLDRGVVFALAHVRGGGELGRRWYLDGKLARKTNSFDDLVAATEHLVATGWAAPDRVAIRGASAGGLLVAATWSRRPDLYAVVVAEVPFVDCLTTLLDPSLPLTVTEWEEWGDPRRPDDFAAIRSWSPYENVPSGPAPAMYVTAGLHDPRVAYHEPAKWVAKLRATTEGGGPIVLRTELRAGHGGPSGRYDRWREEARVLAFVLDALGVPEP